MTNPIAVSQQRRRILARQICAWARSTSLSAKDAEDFACAAIDAFEAEIRADERERAAKVADAFAGYIGDQASHPQPLPIDTNEGWRRVRDGALDIAQSIRNQKDHDHE